MKAVQRRWHSLPLWGQWVAAAVGMAALAFAFLYDYGTEDELKPGFTSNVVGLNVQADAPELAISGLRVNPVVTPAAGDVHTDFTVSFTARERTGIVGEDRRSYLVSARGPAGNGCVIERKSFVEGAKPGSRAKVTLKAAGGGAGGGKGTEWCGGTVRGRVTIRAGYACLPETCKSRDEIPPEREQTVGRFSFRVD